MIALKEKVKAEHLSLIYLKVYKVLVQQFKNEEDEFLEVIFKKHMETAFNFVQHPQKAV